MPSKASSSAVASASSGSILIKGGKVVNHDKSEICDILIEDGVIKEKGVNLTVSDGVTVIDASNKLVMPGGIDTHTHLQMPFMGTHSIDDFYGGTRAALAGGTTHIIDFVIPKKGESLITAYRQWRNWADPKVCCDYSLHMAVTHWSEKVKDEMQEIVSSRCGINSFKVFMAYKDLFMLNDGELLQVLKRSKEIGALTQVHAENGDVIAVNQKRLLAKGITGPEGHLMSRPECVETEAVHRACVLSRQTQSPLYVVHVMSKTSAECIKQMKESDGGHAVIYGEPIAASLATNGSHYFNTCWRHAAAHVLSPPLREQLDTPDHLMELLASGDLDCTGTDNCTFSSEQKAAGRNDFTKIPNGVNGLEDRMSLIWTLGVKTGKMSIERFVEVTSTTAAKIFNIYPEKGVLEVGSAGDVVVMDPDKSRTISAETHNHATDFNIFEGMKVFGIFDFVLSRGRVMVDNGSLVSKEKMLGKGKFVSNSPFTPFVYDKVKIWSEYVSESEKKVERKEDDVTVRSVTGERGKKSFPVTNDPPVVKSNTSVKVRQPPGGRSSIFS